MCINSFFLSLFIFENIRNIWPHTLTKSFYIAICHFFPNYLKCTTLRFVIIYYVIICIYTFLNNIKLLCNVCTRYAAFVSGKIHNIKNYVGPFKFIVRVVVSEASERIFIFFLIQYDSTRFYERLRFNIMYPLRHEVIYSHTSVGCRIYQYIIIWNNYYIKHYNNNM